MKASPRRPDWLKVRAKVTDGYRLTQSTLERLNLNTVCQEAACPNIWDCWSRKEATFLILGDNCTRACLYCRVAEGETAPPSQSEPGRISQAVSDLGLGYAVITSVTRDDLADGGGTQFAAVATAIRAAAPECKIELLVPDFAGVEHAVPTIMQAGVDVIGHNIETVGRLFPAVRPQADYGRSLTLLARLSAEGALVKSALMVGLGESRAEVRAALEDLRDSGVELVAIGQYLPPTADHFPVDRFWRPEEFMGLAAYARRLGFSRVLSGPLVRSSYRSAACSEHLLTAE